MFLKNLAASLVKKTDSLLDEGKLFNFNEINKV